MAKPAMIEMSVGVRLYKIFFISLLLRHSSVRMLSNEVLMICPML